ncbi:MAG: AMP-binding protein [Deltaproteobacteria bacterium]|nr:AMP-binding protein [Deltaproteobacteria bacterium]
MKYKPIAKTPWEDMAIKSNLRDYEATRRDFDWETVRSSLSWLPGGGLNMAFEAIDRHCLTWRKNKVALHWISKNLTAEKYTFQDLKRLTDRFANVLQDLGLQKGDRVFIFLGRIPELYIAAFGTLKAGGVVGPLFSAFGPEAIRDRLRDSGAKVLVTCPELKVRVDEIRAELPDLQHIIVVERDQPAGSSLGAGEINYRDAMAQASRQAKIVQTTADDYAVMHYTSGTTGKPKGAILTQANYFIPNGYINAIEWGLTAADRQLITTPLTHRTAFGRVINMLCLGTTLVILPKFDPRETARLCAAERITVLGMVPTVGRMLLPEIEASARSFASLRVMVATGEAFPREVKERILRALPHVGIHSYFAMTECGALTSLGPAHQLSHPNSVGRLVPGVEVRFVDAAGRDTAPGEAGELWVRSGEPGRFLTLRGYWGQPAETAAALHDGWFATGDMGRMDANGFLYIVDRKKDMVLSGGYNIYSKEVELAILEHPSVLDVAVVGVPDAVYGEAVAAFVELKPGAALTEEQLVAHCRDRIAGYKKPRHVRFVGQLPRNSVGKIIKYKLREELAAAAAS